MPMLPLWILTYIYTCMHASGTSMWSLWTQISHATIGPSLSWCVCIVYVRARMCLCERICITDSDLVTVIIQPYSCHDVYLLQSYGMECVYLRTYVCMCVLT